MALSPAQRHSAMIRAERALECRQALAGHDSLHLQVRALENDLARLKALPRTAERIALKRDELLPRWMPTVENYLAAGEVHAHPVFAWCVIWLFDVGDFDRALDWADIAIAQRQPTPETIRRGFAPFVADTVLAWAEEEAGRGHALVASVAEINLELAGLESRYRSEGYRQVQAVPGVSIDGKTALIAQYEKAVFSRAKADLLGEYATLFSRAPHAGQENPDTRSRLLAEAATVLRIANRLKNDYRKCPDMWQRSIAGCYQNNVAWL